MFGLEIRMMRFSECLTLLFFAVFTVLAWLRPFTTPRRRGTAAIGITGITLILAAVFGRRFMPFGYNSVIRDWLPVLLMPMVYWQTGRFFKTPNKSFQLKLENFDKWLLRLVPQRLADQGYFRLLSPYFEMAYLFCYPLVPLGIAALYSLRMRERSEEFWAVVLPSAFLCYGATAFVHTLPPRMLDAAREQGRCPGGTRELNLWVLRHASIQVNTFPSAHVAATAAASLALIRLAPHVGYSFLWVSLSIAVGAVAGRYHYAADALLGALLAVVVFLLAVLCFG